MFGGIYFAGAAFAGVLGGVAGPLPPVDTSVGIIIDGIHVTARVRVQGVQIRDVLNDAPNTCDLTIEGDGPAVGQRVEVLLGPRSLFAGAVQTIDQAYESKPDLLVWHLTAIDDTGEANARRPFGTWVDTSATTIAQSLTTTYAPGFSSAGIEAGLPAVSIVFDGADTFIACLARLATAVGGYCKVQDHTVYLFLEDLTDPPAPIDDAHRFLASPPIQVNTDRSQLRTRVYGKGYGENILADLAAGETLVPIQDGVNFPPLGGTAITALTADGAQSDRVTFTGVELAGGGTLVGPGAAPGAAPVLALQGGAGVTTGPHTVSVVYVTALGKTLASPPGAITAGVHAPPSDAPAAGTPLSGTGPDQGSHDYAVSFVTNYGETVPGPIGNAVATSAAVGQLPNATAPYPGDVLQGAGIEDGSHAYACTFVNATGETTNSGTSGYQTTGPRTTGAQPAITASAFAGSQNTGTTGGSLTPNTTYWFAFTNTTVEGETTPASPLMSVTLGAGQNACTLPLAVHSDPRCTGRKIYRSTTNSQGPFHLLATVSNNTATSWFDTAADTAIQGNPSYPLTNTTANPGTSQPWNRILVSSIPIGPAGTTGRRLYRTNSGIPFRLVTTIGNNTATSYTDSTPTGSLGADIPTSNTTGTAAQRVPVTNIPIGPISVTSRKLYRRFNGAGTFKLVTTIANNTGTSFTDAVANSALGANALTVATAVGNQILAGIPKGAAAVTAREIYLSPTTDQNTRRLVAIINDNTTATVTILTPDSGISGATEPIADTSGLAQPQGQVNPGSTVLPLAAAATFKLAGGWVSLAGGQTVRYTGISAQTLTGIPPTGPGSITTTVLYGSQAIPAPMLVGVTGLARAVQKGSAIHIWIQRDDLLAQAEEAARTGGDGIVEYLLVDARRTVDSLTARCDADLAVFSRPLVTVSYATRDLQTKSGKTITINLPSQRLAATLTIQEVTITELDIAPGLPPRFTARASNVRFSLEDTLRRLIAGGQVVGGST